MGKLIGGLLGMGGKDKAGKIARQQAAEQQRMQLARLAEQQSEVDQAAARTKRSQRSGRSLLTFLGSGSGQATLG